jgi:hypothetical protein
VLGCIELKSLNTKKATIKQAEQIFRKYGHTQKDDTIFKEVTVKKYRGIPVVCSSDS